MKKVWNTDHYDIVDIRIDDDGNEVEAVVKCLRGDEMQYTQRQLSEGLHLYEYRGELLDTAAIAAINERQFCLQAELDEVNEQIRVFESAQKIELPTAPDVKWLEETYMQGMDADDLRRTQEDALI